MISAAAKAGGRFVILRHLGTFLSVWCRNQIEGEAVLTDTGGTSPNNGLSLAGDTTAFMHTNSSGCRSSRRDDAKQIQID